MSALKIALIGAALSFVGQGAWAQKLGAENCRATSDIVAQAVVARSAGLTAAQAKARLTEGEAAVGEKFRPTVPVLVDWVYGMEASEATPAVATAYEKQCLAF
jgi:hypothetical protein